MQTHHQLHQLYPPPPAPNMPGTSSYLHPLQQQEQQQKQQQSPFHAMHHQTTHLPAPWGSPTSSQTTMPTSCSIPTQISVPSPPPNAQRMEYGDPAGHYPVSNMMYQQPQQQQPHGSTLPEYPQHPAHVHYAYADTTGIHQQSPRQYPTHHQPPQHQQPRQQHYPPPPVPPHQQQQQYVVMADQYIVPSTHQSSPHNSSPPPPHPPPPHDTSSSLSLVLPSTKCQYCHVDRNANGLLASQQQQQQQEQEQRKIELLQEQISVDQQLIVQEKKMFKKRLKLAKTAMHKAQQNFKQQQRQRSLEWVELQQQAETAMRDKIAQVEQSTREKMTQLQQSMILQEKTFRKERQALESKLKDTTEDYESTKAAYEILQKQQQIEQQPQETIDTTLILQKEVEQLKRDLQERDETISSLEMQLLEADRNTKDSQLPHRRPSSSSMINVVTNGGCPVDLCGNCASNERRLADAQLQIDTLTSKQSVLDGKLSKEHQRYESLQTKYHTLVSAQEEYMNANQKRLALMATVQTLQDQLVELQMANEQYEEQVQEKTLVQETLEQELAQTRQKIQELDQTNQTLHETVTTVQQKLVAATAKWQSMMKKTKTASGDPNHLEDDDDDNLSIALERTKVYEKEWTTNPDYIGLYTGEWRNNVPDGNGTLRLDDGAVYDGRWKLGQPHGRGVWATCEGDLYHGEWRNGQKHGRMVEILSDGRVYRGEYQLNERNGHGSMTWPYGAYYLGHFVADKRTGEGIYYYADGDRKYTGTYLDDRPHGYGVMTKTIDGSVLYDGQWAMGEFVGEMDKLPSPQQVPPAEGDNDDDDGAEEDPENIDEGAEFDDMDENDSKEE